MPIRTCAGCRRRWAQRELIRVVRGRGGDVSVDPGPRGAAPGRGAYVCPERPCIERAFKGGLRKTLRYEGALPDALKDELLAKARREREGHDGEAQGS